MNRIAYSRVHSDSIAHVLEKYFASGVSGCHFYMSGLHDNYLIHMNDGKYIFRLYRLGWKNKEEIQFELEYLRFLGKKNFSVAVPVPIGNSLYLEFDCPEGCRQGALFSFAEGVAPGKKINLHQTYELGRSVANLHVVSNDFESIHRRPELSLPYLLDRSVQSFWARLSISQQRFIEDFQKMLHANLDDFEKQKINFGPCSGDINGRNVHFDQSAGLCLIDFDQCGYGYRAFEIAKFFAYLHGTQIKKELEDKFLQAYTESVYLQDCELAAIPYYEMVAHIWVAAIHVENVDLIGEKYLQADFWQERIDILSAFSAE